MTISENNLTVKMTLVTPALAENFLTFNTKNRKVSSSQITFLSNEMRNNRFIENGESIVFDNEGQLKDGQHRLRAIVNTGLSYYIPIVRGVQKKSMATYDTGRNRSAGDILSLNNYLYPTTLSATIKLIDLYSVKNSRRASSTSSMRREALTNQQILTYCEENYDWILDTIKKVKPIYELSKPKVLALPSLSLIAYLIGGEKPSSNVISFLKNLIGLQKEEGTAASYLYTKLLNSKINKDPLNFYWILGMTIKAWNYYSDGNPSLKSFRFDVSKQLPKINKDYK